MLTWCYLQKAQLLTHGQRRKGNIFFFLACGFCFDVIIGGFLINLQESVELHNAAVLAEQVILRRNFNGRLVIDRRIHL